jgi:Holliday junction DNA helicase RuvA
MIAFLSGRLASKGEDHCVLDVCGVGYRIAMPTGSLAALPAEGDEVMIHTHLHVREDELSIFGFEGPGEKGVFERLITVSGVGPKVALAAMSSYDAEALTQAIADEDVALISSVPGIGKKTAQRIILDLKDKLVTDGSAAPGGAELPSAVVEVREALASMGFTPAEAAAATKGFEGEAGDTEALLQHALSRLGGGS